MPGKHGQPNHGTESSNRADRTRGRLLVAAGRIFAEKGFQEATIAEICKQAESNIASVNYHFGDKETLYLEAWRFAFKRELELFPSDGGVSEQAAPEQRLAGRIKAMMHRIADDRSYSFMIIHREMAHPTRLLADILEKEINPQRIQMLKLIKECVGCGDTDQQILYCHASIMGQCFQLLRLKHLQKARLHPAYAIDLNEVDAFIEHVVRFSLAGIQTLRAQHIY